MKTAQWAAGDPVKIGDLVRCAGGVGVVTALNHDNGTFLVSQFLGTGLGLIARGAGAIKAHEPMSSRAYAIDDLGHLGRAEDVMTISHADDTIEL